MPEKKPAALNQISYDVMKIRVLAKLPKKNLYVFRKKLMIYYFCVSTIMGILKVIPGASVSNAFFLNTAQLETPGYFLQLL